MSSLPDRNMVAANVAKARRGFHTNALALVQA
jgi:hypothetical protein